MAFAPAAARAASAPPVRRSVGAARARHGVVPAHRRPTARLPRTRDPRRHQRAHMICVRSKDGDVTESEAESKQGTAPDAGAATGAAQLLAKIVASPVFYLVAGLGSIYLLSLTGETVGPIVVFSALPVVGLTLLSKSDIGKQVQEKLEEELPELEAEAELQRKAWDNAIAKSPYFGEERSTWPGILGGPASHLTGQVAGDFGFDPLGLAKEPEALANYRESELLHARWAMLAAVGAPIPEVLDLCGVDVGEPIWWKVGAAKLSGDITINYAGIEGFRIAGKQGIAVIALCQLVLMGGPEYARYVGIKSLQPVGVFLPGEPDYPGGTPFDPLNYAKQPQSFVEQTVKEIKNGRIAMMAVLGYYVQAIVTREGPVHNLLSFLEDPLHNNIVGQLLHS